MNLLEERKNSKLHPLVEERLKKLIAEVFPTAHTLPEGYGISSGRTDSTVYFVQGGGVAHYELIASESMVFRDVNNLRTSVADAKFVILMDERLDKKVPNAYFRAVPKNEFPIIWLSELMDEKKKEEIKAFLMTQMGQLEVKVKDVETIADDRMKAIANEKYANGLRMEILLIPRQVKDFLGMVKNEDEIWNYFEQFQISTATSIDATSTLGKSWRFWDGDFAVVDGLPDKFFQSLRIAEDGSVRLTLFSQDDDRDINYLDNLTSDVIYRKIEQLCTFSNKLFIDKGVSGFCDLVFYIDGIEGRHWEINYQDPFVDFSGKKTFTVRDFKSRVFPIMVEDLVVEEKVMQISDEISIFLLRRTKKVKKQIS